MLYVICAVSLILWTYDRHVFSKEIQKLKKEVRIPLGEASKQATLLVSYCQGEFNYDGVLERKDLNRDKLDADLFNLLVAIKKLEFQVQDLTTTKGK